MFHPTWDEWKRSHINEKNSINNNLNESISFTKVNSDNFSNKQKIKNESNDNKNTFNTSDSIEKNTTTRSFIEETMWKNRHWHAQVNRQGLHTSDRTQRLKPLPTTRTRHSPHEAVMGMTK